MNTKAVSLLSALVCVGLCALVVSQVTVFVVQPIGLAPEGMTLIVSRLKTTYFLDSADAMCERRDGGVSILCRLAALASVGKDATVYARLPYSAWLYLASTGGKEYAQ